MSRSSEDLLREALEHFEASMAYGETMGGDPPTQMAIDAIALRLAAGVDALRRLGAEEREAHFDAQWAAMWGMRNRIVHGYLLVDPALVRQTIEVDLPGIVTTLRQAIGD